MDALGNLVRFILMPANRYDTVGVAPLIQGVQFGAMLADKAFDSNWIIPLGRFCFTKSPAGQWKT